MMTDSIILIVCNTTYHNNYSVSNHIRTYYPGVPDAVEVGKHQFVTRDVLNMFMNLMLISWSVSFDFLNVSVQ